MCALIDLVVGAGLRSAIRLPQRLQRERDKQRAAAVAAVRPQPRDALRLRRVRVVAPQRLATQQKEKSGSIVVGIRLVI